MCKMSQLMSRGKKKLIIILLFISIFAPTVGADKVTNVVLVGSTGDLARRYLWSGLFDLYLQEHGETKSFRFYAAARENKKSGTEKTKETLKTSLGCENRELCDTSAVENFKKLTEYFALKKEEDYVVLCSAIEENLRGDDQETGRLFYLSVPPFAYEQIARNIDKHCRPSKAWLRVVLEKPFGSDLKSSHELASILSRYLSEEEMYRIDHYLGKPGVTQLLKFRFQNKEQFGDLWNKDHIERVEIVLKEKSDCEGRTNFYNQYGVIRDVMQNHMTELMAMVAMETPSSLDNITDIRRKKIQLLKDIRPLRRKSAVLGQYRDYNMHLVDHDSKSLTPTFAAVVMSVDNARWQGVPFVFVSGKQLDERVAYVRLIFKDNDITVGKTLGRETCGSRQLVFHIQGGEVQQPALIISHDLPYPASTYGWLPDSRTFNIFGCQSQDFHVFVSPESHSAYSTLISGVFHGQKDFFVGTEDLLASWEVWTPLLESLEHSIPSLYDNSDLDVLRVSVKGMKVEFVQEELDGTCEKDKCSSWPGPVGEYKNGSFRGSPLISGTKDYVITKLASEIESNALASVDSQGAFHLALSGGSTPAPLFEELSFSRPGFPWKQTHIWIVDERCVSLDNRSSNFFNLHTALLRHVPIQQFNIHPMPIFLQGGLCHQEDLGALHYEAALKWLLGNKQLDFVLLGVGHDGHIASLFPQQLSLQETEHWVTLTESGGTSHLNMRMTMTFPILNNAKAVSVLVLGEGKKDIVRKISDRKVDVVNLPVTGLQPRQGSLSWYIDDEALDSLDVS